MPNIDLTGEDFQSLAANIPRVKLSNMYVVENPLSPSGFSYLPRPSVEEYVDVGSGPARGVWFQSSKGRVTLYVVSGSSLYSVDPVSNVVTEIGAIDGTSSCTFCSTLYYIAIASSGFLYLYDGTTLTKVEIPDDLEVTDVTSLDNYIIVGIKNTTKMYWIRPGEVTIEPLDFVSAERSPDDIISVSVAGDELWALGQEGCEVFQSSGDASASFTRIPGRFYPIGCLSKYSVTQASKDSLPCLIWVSASREVILAQGHPAKISNEAIEELLKSSTSFKAWYFRTQKHDFYALTTDSVTVVYDLNSGSWYRWSTYLKDKWDVVSGFQVNDVTYCITDIHPKLYKLVSGLSATDFFTCEVGAFIPNPVKTPTPCNHITLFVNYGFSNSYEYSPLIELRWSDDGGHTWSDYMQYEVGLQGRYSENVSFRSLGAIRQPGRYIEIRFSEAQSFRLDGAIFND